MPVEAAVAPRQTSAAPRVEASLRPGRRGWLLVGGLLAMVVCAGSFVLLYLGSDARVSALVVARPVAAGQLLTAADLQTVRIVPDAGVELVAAGEASQVVGRPAAVPLVEGALLSDSQLGPVGWPPAGQAVAAVPVEPGRLPAGIAAGSRVLVVPVAADTPVEPGQPPAASGVSAVPVEAMVVQVVEAVDGSGTSVVSLLLAQPDAVTIAAAGGDLALVLAEGSGG